MDQSRMAKWYSCVLLVSESNRQVRVRAIDLVLNGIDKIKAKREALSRHDIWGSEDYRYIPSFFFFPVWKMSRLLLRFISFFSSLN